MTELAKSTPTPGEAGLQAHAARLRAALWRYLRVLGADPAAADDLVQEAFLVALRRPGFDGRQPGAVFTFLRTTARHLWLRSHRRRVSEQQVDDACAVWDARCGEGTGDDYVDALRRCLETLPPRSRELLHATYADDEGRAASAARLGLSTDGIKSALRRLRTFLHDCIGQRLAEDPR